MATEKAKGVATGSGDRSQLIAPTPVTDSAGFPDRSFTATHTGDVAGAVSRQRLTVDDLYPEFGQDADIIKHKSLFKGLTYLDTPTGSVTMQDEFAQTMP